MIDLINREELDQEWTGTVIQTPSDALSRECAMEFPETLKKRSFNCDIKGIWT